MSEIDFDEEFDDNLDDNDFEYDENGLEEEDNQFELDDDDEDNILNTSQFYNKNDYEDITKIESEIQSEDKKSNNRITKYECTKVIGIRAQQLASGMPSFVNTHRMTNVIDIAIKELKENKIPFIIRRPMQDGKYEYWRVSDLKPNHNINLTMI